MFTNPNFTKIYNPEHTVLGSIAKADAGVWVSPNYSATLAQIRIRLAHGETLASQFALKRYFLVTSISNLFLKQSRPGPPGLRPFRTKAYKLDKAIWKLCDIIVDHIRRFFSIIMTLTLTPTTLLSNLHSATTWS